MKKNFLNRLNYLTMLFALPVLMFLAGCSDEDDNSTSPTVNESELVAQYLEANGDFLNTSLPAIISASGLKTDLTADPTKILVIDVRDTTAFKNGHIAGAVNKTIPQLPAYFKSITPSAYNKIVLTCYTGQSASYATALLKLSGYNNVYSLKWGMCSWDTAFMKNYWPKKISNGKAAMFVKDSIAKPALGALPTLSTGLKDGKAILDKRIADLFAAGYNVAVTADQVFSDYASDPAKNFVINYWPFNQYKEIGHIPGAYQYTPKSDLKLSTYLKTLPTTKPIVIYCYTGQTSAQLSAVLKVLGYDAKSLSFGANSMAYDEMNGKTGYTVWKDTECMNYEVVKE